MSSRMDRPGRCYRRPLSRKVSTLRSASPSSLEPRSLCSGCVKYRATWSAHASPSTWTLCLDSGRRFLRCRGHIDIVPAGQEGGFDAETPCDTLELQVPPGLIERVADEAGRFAMRSSLQPRHMLTDEKICHLAWALEDERYSARPAGRLFVDSVGVALATQLLGLTEPILK